MNKEDQETLAQLEKEMNRYTCICLSLLENKDPSLGSASPDSYYLALNKWRAKRDERDALLLKQPPFVDEKSNYVQCVEKTSRYITSTTYERQQKRLDKEICARLKKVKI